MNRFHACLKKDGWLIAALGVCIALCLALSASGAGHTEEGHISRVLSAISGAGAVEVAVHYDGSAPCGAVVVAEGAGDMGVRIDLISAVTTLLGIDGDRVAVYPREAKE